MTASGSGFAAGLIRTKDGDSEGAHLPLIPRSTFERYERERDRRAKMHPRQRSPQHYLSGLVECGLCGAPAYVTSTTSPKAVFRCRTYATEGKGACPGTFLLRTTAENRLGIWLAGQQDSLLDAAREAVPEKTDARARVDRCQDEVDLVEGRLARLIKMHLEEGLDDAVYKQTRGEFEAELSRARSALDDAYTALGLVRTRDARRLQGVGAAP